MSARFEGKHGVSNADIPRRVSYIPWQRECEESLAGRRLGKWQDFVWRSDMPAVVNDISMWYVAGGIPTARLDR